MRITGSNRGWIATAALALGYLVLGTSAEDSPKDLGALLSGEKNLTTFYGLIQKYPQILLRLPSLKGVTILAPNNDAFSKIPYTELNAAFQNNDQATIMNILEYHIVEGSKTAAELKPGEPAFLPTLLTNPAWTNVTGGQNVENIKQAGDVVIFVSGKGNRCTVTQQDLKFDGGVVQAIDSLLIPPSNFTETTTSFNLTSFQGGLYATKKIQNITASKDITIFAPQNLAFQNLGPAISNMTVEQLSSVLDYHIISSGITFSSSLKNGTKLTTNQGGNITVRQSGNNVYINSAQLLTTDILLSNGVLHVIGNVLNPDSSDAQPDPKLETQVPVFAAATSVESLPFTSAIPCTTSCPVTETGSATGTVTGGATKPTSAGSGVHSSSSKALGAALARETGFGTAGLMVALGGAVMMI